MIAVSYFATHFWKLTGARYSVLYLVPVSVLVLPYRCPTYRLQCAQVQYQTTVPGGMSDNAFSKILPVQVPYVSQVQNHFVLKRLKISHESIFFFSKPRLFFQTELLENRVTFFSSKSVKSVP